MFFALIWLLTMQLLVLMGIMNYSSYWFLSRSYSRIGHFLTSSYSHSKGLLTDEVKWQLCMWSIDGWEMKKSRIIQTPATHAAPMVGDTKIQFHNDQTHLLVVHESQLAIYDNKLESLCSVSFCALIIVVLLKEFMGTMLTSQYLLLLISRIY